jgi:plastocyanin
MRHLRFILAAAAVAALGCGGDNNPSGPTGGTGGATVTVGSGGFNFNPSAVTIAANSTVTWNWNSGGVVHNVTFTDGTTSGNKSSGSYQRTFPTTGSFSYMCTIHGSIMSGTVTVTSASGNTGGSGGGGGGGGGAYP